MANISTATARTGYELYRSSGFKSSWQEVNQALEELNHPPVSERMYRHYRNLASAGFNRYISINRFDVARAAEPYENLSTKSRYKFSDSQIPARVTFPRGRKLVEALGNAERIGETGLILWFESEKTVAALTDRREKPKAGETVRVELLDPPRQFDGRVIDLEQVGDQVVLEIEFQRLESIGNYIGREPLAAVDYGIRLVIEEGIEPTIDVIGGQLYHLFEVIESSRSVVNEISSLSHDDRYATVVEIRRLRMQSPLYTLVGLPEPVAVVLAMAFGVLSTAIVYERWRGRRLANNSQDIENQAAEAEAELRKKKAELEAKILEALDEQFQLGAAIDPKKLTTVKQLLDDIDNLAVQDVDRAQLLPPRNVPPKASEK